MKNLFYFLLLTTFGAHAQTGKLVCDVEFDNYEFDLEYNVKLTKDGESKFFYNVENYDTLKGIDPGMYTALFYCCDSSYLHQQMVNIEANKTTYFEFYGSSYTWIYDDEEDFQDSNPVYVGYTFGMGIPEVDRPHNAFSGSVFVGFDQQFGESPITGGMEYSFEYNQTNYGNVDLNDPQILHESQRLSNFNFSIAAHTGLIIRNNKIMNLGVRYHLPMTARFVVQNGDSKVKTKGVHNYNDIRAFARVGFAYGFVYAEYRPTQFLKSDYPDVPKLTLGICYTIPYY